MFAPSDDRRPLILVGVDGSETSMRAGAYAAGMASRQNSRLTCLYVHSPNVLGASVPAVVAATVEHNSTIAQELREMIEAQAPQLGLVVTFVERYGSPYAALVQLADEIRADAIVVGASTKSGHRFVGSLATHLVRDARWPVIVVP
ncbi:MAG: universal stress protein [Jatrophihabitantaceae bacterium]